MQEDERDGKEHKIDVYRELIKGNRILKYTLLYKHLYFIVF